MLTDGRSRHVLLVSPQPWQGLQVSKHHYARALAALGHRVDFVEPPRTTGRLGAIDVAPVAGEPAIRVIGYRPPLPQAVKFHARGLFDRAMRWQARRIVRAAGGSPDIVWDFDNAYQFADLRAFGGGVRVLHLVDQVGAGVAHAKQAELVVGLDDSFLDRIGARALPHLSVPHGLNPHHLALARRVDADPTPPPRAAEVRVGYVGNLAMPAVDREAIDRIVAAHPGVHFAFVTPVPPAEVADRAAAAWIAALAGRPNCTLHTGLGAAEIAALASRIDVWLTCYDLRRDGNAGVNSHKMLEYLATGAPVLTSWLQPYEASELVVMADRGDNTRLPALLRTLIADLPAHDAPHLRQARARVALAHDYAGHVATISDALARLRTAA